MMQAIESITADQTLHTGDLGGRATTAQVTRALRDRHCAATARPRSPA